MLRVLSLSVSFSSTEVNGRFMACSAGGQTLQQMGGRSRVVMSLSSRHVGQQVALMSESLQGFVCLAQFVICIKAYL